MHKFSKVILVAAITLFALPVVADTQSDMERLFGKKVADQTNTVQSSKSTTGVSAPISKSKNAGSFSVTDADVEGVRVGQSYQVAKSTLIERFPDVEGLQQSRPDSSFALVNPAKCPDGGFYPCKGGYKEKNRADNSLIKQVSISVFFSKSGLVKSIDYELQAKVAEDEAGCNAIIDRKINEYLGLFGEPDDKRWRDKRKKEWFSPDFGDYFTWYPECNRQGVLKEKINVNANSIK